MRAKSVAEGFVSPSLTHDRLAPSMSGAIRRGKIRLSRSGVHWFERRSGLNILLDDVDVPSENWSWAPRYLSLALTNACELSCPYCYAPKVPGRLAMPQVLAWLQELDAGGCLGVGLGGGEPTAHPDFARICREAAGHTSLAISFTTHGHRIDRRLADAIRGSAHFVRVSVDGVGHTYEQLRGRSFDDLLRRLDIIATIAPFGLNVVVNDQTVSQLDALAALAHKVGASELLLLPQQPARGSAGMSQWASDRLRQWASDPKPVRLSISRAGIPEGIPLADPFGEEDPLEAHAHIDAGGSLKPHAYADHGVDVAGSVRDALEKLRQWRAA